MNIRISCKASDLSKSLRTAHEQQQSFLLSSGTNPKNTSVNYTKGSWFITEKSRKDGPMSINSN